MSSVIDKFLRYVSYDTQSKDEQEQLPSTEKQFALARLLEEELKAMGASDVKVDGQCYVTATIPATISTDANVPVLGFIAHMDTSPAFGGCNVRPQIIKNYDGSPIALEGVPGLYLNPAEFPDMLDYVGKDLITTDGTTLLGADDKAGVAEIMAMAEYFLSHPEIPHGEIKIGFTPDEEVGRGADGFDVAAFGADVAYTVDGGALGELEYENFNAASCQVSIKGLDIHPGDAKNQMKNAAEIAMEFHQLLPENEKPQYTEKYEGFFHLTDMKGTVGEARLDYIIRDHDPNQMIRKKQILADIQHFLCRKYNDPNLIHLHIQDSYSNMKALIDRDPRSVIRAEKAMEKLKITALSTPIRGGTDGARLTVRGLNTPNLGTGGYNCHGPYEFACLEEMETVVRILI